MGETVPRFTRGYDPAELDAAVRDRGAAVIEQAYPTAQCDTFLTEVEDYLAAHPEDAADAGAPRLGGGGRGPPPT
ncbi:hypothetical protein AB8O38_09570, partial [Saccharomonospora xinjiangensis]|uniref:hypothetical protein n=1 Tax=Saccharomonospora xinjiangensis TaxID=75294 RepID=UPI00350EFA26